MNDLNGTHLSIPRLTVFLLVNSSFLGIGLILLYCTEFYCFCSIVE